MKAKAILKLTLLVAVFFMVLGLTRVSTQANVLLNGDFQADLQNWIISPAIPGSWNPLQSDGANKYVNLDPMGPGLYNYSGTLLYQNLNVALGPNKIVNFSARIKGWVSMGEPISFYLDYVDSLTNSIQKVRLANPDSTSISNVDFVLIEKSLTLPSTARKITKLLIAKEGYGSLNVDDITVDVAGAAPGLTPFISSISQESGAYGSQFVITGRNFGTNAGSVLLGGSPQGLAINNWTDTAITVNVQEPAQSGRVVVLADFVESNIDRSFKVTSPNFTVDVYPPQLTVVRGAKANFTVGVKFYNNFTTLNGINFNLSGAPNLTGLFAFAPLPVRGNGGSVLMIDTASLAPGVYSGKIDSQEANSLSRSAPFVLNVIEVAQIRFTSGYPDNNPITTLAVSKQGSFYPSYQILDSSGKELPWGIAGGQPDFQSDNSILLTAKDQWGYYFYANDNGTATMTARTVDGRTANLAVTITVPDSPKVLSASLSPSQVTNKSTDPIQFQAQYSPNPPSVGYTSYQSFISFPTNIEYDRNTFSYGGTFQIAPNVEPGQYRMSANILEPGVYTPIVERFIILDVINDPVNGLISGLMKSPGGGSGGPHSEIGGQLKFYDSTTGEIIKQASLFSMGRDSYSFSLPAGSYKVEFSPYSGSSQFYPAANDLAGAAIVTVGAGQETRNINFVLKPTVGLYGFVREEGANGHETAVPYASVGVYNLSGGNPVATGSSSYDGSFTVSGLPLNFEGYAKVSKSPDYKNTYSFVKKLEYENVYDARLEIMSLANFNQTKTALEAAGGLTYDSSKGIIGGSVSQRIGQQSVNVPGVVVELWNQDGTLATSGLQPIYFNSQGQPDNALTATVADGGFAFVNVPAGIYTLKVLSGGVEKGSAKAGAYADGVTLGKVEVQGVLPPYIVRANSGHQAPFVWGNPNEQYWVSLTVEDPESRVLSVSVTGPGIANPLSLAYDPNQMSWVSWRTEAGNPNFGSTPPNLPLDYTFTVTDNTGTTTVNKSINSFVNVFASNLSPAGVIHNLPTSFSWTADQQTGFRYGLELNGQNGNRIWSAYDLSSTQVSYGGPTLDYGSYNYTVNINDSEGNVSFTPGSFSYRPIEDKGDLNGDQALTLEDAIIALKVACGLQVDLVYDFSINDVDGHPGISLAEAIYVLQRVAGVRMP